MLRDITKSPCPEAIIIGLTGNPGSGKTSAARRLCSAHSFVCINFEPRLDGIQVWLNKLKEHYKETGRYTRIVADPVWLPAQHQAIKEMGGTIIRLEMEGPIQEDIVIINSRAGYPVLHDALDDVFHKILEELNNE